MNNRKSECFTPDVLLLPYKNVFVYEKESEVYKKAKAVLHTRLTGRAYEFVHL
jgi:hypothetical protein